MIDVICPYCRQPAELVDSIAVYERSYGMLWMCRPCEAWVGVHKDSKEHKPLGSLANAELRRARQLAHKAFDPHWLKLIDEGLSKSQARKRVYQRLAGELGIDVKDCHIAQSDDRRCWLVMTICARWEKAATKAAASQDIDQNN